MAVRSMFADNLGGGKQPRPTLDQLCDTIGGELQSFEQCFLVLDGLDEMPKNEERVELLRRLESLKPMPNLFVASRPLPDISEWFTGNATDGKYLITGDLDECGSEYAQDICCCENCETLEEDWDFNLESDRSLSDPSSTHKPSGPTRFTNNANAMNSWRAKASYRCKNPVCRRDVCVNCYDRYDNCLGCNKQKDCFEWAWLGAMTIAAHADDIEQYIDWRIQTSRSLLRTIEIANANGFDLRSEIVATVQRIAHNM